MEEWRQPTLRLFAAPFHLGEAAAALVGRCIATTAGAANNYSAGHDDDDDGQQASQPAASSQFSALTNRNSKTTTATLFVQLTSNDCPAASVADDGGRDVLLVVGVFRWAEDECSSTERRHKCQGCSSSGRN